MMAQRRNGRLVGSLEAMLYVFFFVIALAITGALLAAASHVSHEAARLERAVELAGDAAARFAVDPVHMPESTDADDLKVVCAVEPVSKAFGHIYQATISVLDGDEVVYELETSRYISARGGA